MIPRNIYHLTWDGSVVPKARPKFSSESGQAYMPESYVDMKAAAVTSFMDQWRSLGFYECIDWQVRPYVFAWGRHYRSQDIVDNFPGTLYDALVEAGVLRNDSAKWCPGSVHELGHSKDLPTVDILLAPWTPFVESMGQLAEIIEWLKERG